MIKRRFYLLAIMMVVAHLLTELHSVIFHFWPTTQKYYLGHIFINRDVYVPQLSVLWFIKMLTDTLLSALLCFTGAIQSLFLNYSEYLQWMRYSLRLFLIWSVYVIYHFIDLFLLVYDYRSDYKLYWCIGIINALVVILICLPFRHDRSSS